MSALTPEMKAYHSVLLYAKFMWPGYSTPKHLQVLAAALERVERGECRRLMVFMPPRSGKSQIISKYFPSWYLGRNPEREVICASYAQSLADEWGRDVRNAIASEEFGRVFPGVSLAKDSKSASRLNVTSGKGKKRGVYAAAGVGGPITGRGAHLLVIDDPIKGREDAESPAFRRKLQDWYSSVAYTRLMPGGAIVVLHTRWHEDDLAGYLLREHAQEGWEVLSLPAIAEEHEVWALPGGRTWTREPGDALWPERWPVDVLSQIKAAVGSREWASLYQQRPVPDEGGMCSLSWFKRYRELPQDEVVTRIVQSWDTAVKESQLNDPSSCTTWAETADGGYYLLEVFTERMGYPELRRKVVELAARRYCGQRVSAILIEDKASGSSLLQDLGSSTSLPLIGIEPEGNKQVRFGRVSPLIEGGKVYLPTRAEWLDTYESEVMAFPASKHDDQVDSTSQFLNWSQEGRGEALPEPETMREGLEAVRSLWGSSGSTRGLF